MGGMDASASVTGSPDLVSLSPSPAKDLLSSTPPSSLGSGASHTQKVASLARDAPADRPFCSTPVATRFSIRSSMSCTAHSKPERNADTQ